MNSKQSFFQIQPSWNLLGRPWVIVTYFFLINALLSYFPLALAWKLWLGLFGLGMPLAFILLKLSPPKSGETPGFFVQEINFPLFKWFLVFFLFVGIGLRIFKPLTFIQWILFDETVNAYYALKLDQLWTWHPLFFHSQLPPLLIWMLYAFFKIFGNFLTAIRFLPIFLSLLILILAYPAARVFFPKSFSLLFFSLMAFGFSPLFFGRLCHQGLLLMLLEILSFYFLGQILKGRPSCFPYFLVLLGLCIGLGFYTYFSWLLVAIFLLFIILRWVSTRPRRISLGLWFALGLFPPLIPLFFAFFSSWNSHYLGMLWSLKPGNDWIQQIQTTFSCLSAFCWGNQCSYFSYGPVWGGFLNPLLGAFFLLGLVELLRFWNLPFSRGVLGATVFFLLPAFSTNTLTNMREIQVIPLLLLITSIGIKIILDSFSGKFKLYILMGVLLTSGLFDYVHLQKFSFFINHYWESQKTYESQKAYDILEKISRKMGPGLVLTSFSNDTYTYDQSLLACTYHFNAGQNPSLSPETARWLSVITNIHFQPFLSERFPDGTWVKLSSDQNLKENNYSGGLMLGVIPLSPKNKPLLTKWIQADSNFLAMSSKIMDLPIAEARKEILRLLTDMEPNLSRDRFIRSCYWEMVYFNYSWENLYGDKNYSRNFPASLKALESAIEEGYPTAYFYNELGSLWLIKGDRSKASEAFKQAIRAKLNKTPAEENLRVLENSSREK